MRKSTNKYCYFKGNNVLGTRLIEYLCENTGAINNSFYRGSNPQLIYYAEYAHDCINSVHSTDIATDLALKIIENGDEIIIKELTHKLHKTMNTNEFKIVVPEGMEIDKENSTFEVIKFKPIEKNFKNYEEFYKEFSKNRDKVYYTNTNGQVSYCRNIDTIIYPCINHTFNPKQLEKIMALNQLMNIARYFNGDWQPNYLMIARDEDEAWVIDVTYNQITIEPFDTDLQYPILFHKKEYAKKAIEILGEDTIKEALGTYY